MRSLCQGKKRGWVTHYYCPLRSFAKLENVFLKQLAGILRNTISLI